MNEHDDTIETAPAPDAADNWKAVLPPELRDDPTVARLGSVADGMKMLVHAQRLVGRDRIPLPLDDADPQDWEVVYERLGRPATPEDYELAAPEGEAGALDIDEALTGRFRAEAHRLGLLPHQVKGLYGWFLGEQAAGLAESDGARDAAAAELREAWGAAYDRHLEAARRAARTLGGEDLLRHLEESGLGNDTTLVRALARAGAMLAEAAPPEATARDGFAPAGDGARREIARLQGDESFMTAYRDRLHPDHGGAMDRMRALFRAAYPGPAAGASR